jgi:hypothetical protein
LKEGLNPFLRLLALADWAVDLLQIADMMLVFLIALWILCNKTENNSVCSSEAGLFCPLFYFLPAKVADAGSFCSRNREGEDF